MKKNKILFGLFLLTLAAFGQEVVLEQEHDYRFSNQLMNKEMYDLAAIQFIKFVDKFPSSPNAPQAIINAALCYEKMDSLELAAKYYFDLVLKYPKSDRVDQALFDRGMLLKKMDDPLNAALTLERLLIFTPESNLIPKAQLEAAKSFIEVEDYSKALNAANIVIEKYPEHPERIHAHLIIADIYGKQAKIKFAFNELDKITGNNLRNEITQQALLLKAKLYRESGRYSLSDSILISLVESNIINDYILNAGKDLALSYQAFGEYQKSTSIAEKLLNKQKQGTVPAHLLLIAGDNYVIQKEFETALSFYNQCDTTLLDNQWKSAYLYRMGFVQNKLDHTNPAINSFERILSNKGKVDSQISLHSLLSLASLLDNANRSLEAVNLLQHSLQELRFEKYRDQILFKIGDIQQSGLNDWSGARASYSAIQSLTLKSTLADKAQLKIAETFEKENNTNQALREYKRFLNIFPASDLYSNVKIKVDLLKKQLPEANSNSNKLITSLYLQNYNLTNQPEKLFEIAKSLIYDMHDYQTAISFLNMANASDQNEQIDNQALVYEKAFCHSQLADIYLSTHQPIKANAHIDTLNQIYSLLQQQFPDTHWRYKTLFNKINLDVKSLETGQSTTNYLDSMLVQFPEEFKTDSSYINLELLQIQSLVNTKSDSTDWLKLQKANMICNSIQSKTQNPDLIEQTTLYNATILYRLAETDSALQILDQISYNNTPTSIRAQFLLANLYSDQQQYEKALNIYSKIINMHYYSSLAIESVINSINILYDLDDIARARILIEKYLIYSNNTYLPDFFFKTPYDELIWLSAKLSHKNQEPVKAIQSLQNYLYTSDTPKHQAEALLLLGDISRDANNNEIAIGHYTELITQFPGDTLAQVAREKTADIFFQMEDYQNALKHYKTMKTLQHGDMQIFAYAREVICEFRLGNLEKARNLTSQFSKSFKDQDKYQAEFLYEEGMLQIKQKNFDKAEDAFKSLSKKYDDIPEGAKGELGLARMYVITGKPEDALKILTQIPEDYDDPIILATAYLNLADFYYENRLLPQCIAANEKVLELVDSGMLHRNAMNLLIKTYDQFKLGDKAIALIREFIEKYPNDPDIMIKKVQIGILLHDLKDFDRSISYLKGLKPFVSSTDEPEVQYYIALSYMDKGDFDQAIVEFLKVKYLSKDTKLPWKVSALYQAGIAYRKLGNFDKAIELLQQVVREQGATDSFGQAAVEKIKEIELEKEQTRNG